MGIVRQGALLFLSLFQSGASSTYTFTKKLLITGAANAFGVGTPTTADSTADTILAASATTQTPLVVQGQAGQSANLLALQKSDGTLMSHWTHDGTDTSLRSDTGALNLGNASAYIQISNAGGDPIIKPPVGYTFSFYAGDGTPISQLGGGYNRWDILGGADLTIAKSQLTAGTFTQNVNHHGTVRRVWHRFSWTNAMITALGAVTSGDITVCTLPAKTVVTRAMIVVTTAATFGDTLTMSLGDTGAGYNDYVLAGSIKAAANTVYGDAPDGSETGTNLFSTFFIDRMPSFTGTTAVKVHVDGNATNLSGVTTSTGDVYLETYTLP